MTLYEEKVSRLWLVPAIIFLIVGIFILIQLNIYSNSSNDIDDTFGLITGFVETYNYIAWTFVGVMIFINLVASIIIFGSSLNITDEEIKFKAFFKNNIFLFSNMAEIEKVKISQESMSGDYSSTFEVKKESGEIISPNFLYRSKTLVPIGILISMKNNRTLFFTVKEDDLEKVFLIISNKIAL